MSGELWKFDDGVSQANFIDDAYRVTAQGAELYLELVGPKDAPVVFYLHGGPGYNSHSFRELMGDELLDYRVIYADQRGAGRSPAEDGTLSVEALGDDVLSILDALEVPKATLLAHGFGAMVAAATFARAPERTERLVLVNPWVDMPALAASLQREAARLAGDDEPSSDSDEQLQSGLSPAEMVAQAGREVGGKRLFDALLFSKTSSRLRLEHADAEGFANLQSGAPGADENDDLWSLRADLTPLQQRPVPTAVFVGQQDKSCYPAQAERVLSALPHALFSLLESAHYPWLDDPETFTDLLQQALKLPAE